MSVKVITKDNFENEANATQKSLSCLTSGQHGAVRAKCFHRWWISILRRTVL